MRVATLADADANDGGEPLRGSFLMGLVTPQFVPAAHHCGVCTVVIAFGDVVERPCGGGGWGGSGGSGWKGGPEGAETHKHGGKNNGFWGDWWGCIWENVVYL